MRAVIQRVSTAAVTVTTDRNHERAAEIGPGLLVFVGVERDDGPGDVRYVASKVRDLRIFEDPASGSRHLDRSVEDVGGSVLVVSQFTVVGDCRKGRRPSFDLAAPPQVAKPIYEAFVRELESLGLDVETGEFQAMMQVSLVNEGPVTLLVDSRKRF
jgi:D-tyrosyl-tRNA(Tyr) deacylase